MSFFGQIMDKIFHHPAAASSTPAAAANPATTPAAPAAPTPAASPAAVAAPVDVDMVLTQMAASGNGGNWQTSIVDLLKLLNLDSSLTARTELGKELGVHAGADGSAEQNIALHKAVMNKLAANGGKVPASMLG